MKFTEKQLYSWMLRERQRCVDPRRRALLEAIPGWTWNTHDSAWEEGFSHLQKRGVISVKHIPRKGEYGLGRWIDRQRQTCKNPILRKRLESIPGWSWNPDDDSWEKAFALIQKYGMVGRHFKTESGFTLGRWIDNQRQKCKDVERRKRLESIPGWEWARVGTHGPKPKVSRK